MPYAITNDNVELYYEEVGSGHALIFVHEFAGDWRSWEPQMRFFSRYAARPWFSTPRGESKQNLDLCCLSTAVSTIRAGWRR
jgi:pimeloyl-ACP methyl ester carboxylesterase